MAINPKLEFYKFKLSPDDDSSFKSFRDFAVEELGLKKNPSDSEVLTACFTKFMKELESGFAKDDKRKKTITLVEDKSNKYHSQKPSLLSTKNVFHGVINGGPYDRASIISDMTDKKKSSSLERTKAVLMYHYIFVYIPANHNEGMFMIHSNASDQNITPIFRDYISNIFSGKAYNKPVPEVFAPKKFQKEFKEDAVVKSFTFATTTTVVDSNHTKLGMSNITNDYDIIIKAVPKGKKKTSISDANKIFNLLIKNTSFKTQKEDIALEAFDRKKMEAINVTSKNPKMFEWNLKDSEFVPVVYLNGRVKMLTDGTPDIDSLKKFCADIFEKNVLKEMRPDLDVTKAK